MGAGSVSTRTGVPQEMWDTSSAIQETFRLNGQRNVLMMLDKLDKFKKLMKDIDNLRLGEQERNMTPKLRFGKSGKRKKPINPKRFRS